jgi:Sel1 repeat
MVCQSPGAIAIFFAHCLFQDRVYGHHCTPMEPEIMLKRVNISTAIVLTAAVLGSCSPSTPTPTDDVVQLKQECAGGDSSACYVLGQELDTGSPEERASAVSYYQQAEVLLEPECAEEAQACLWLGDMHHWGQGMAGNEETAQSYYQKGIDLLDRDCTDQNADACMDLQSRYETGEGVDAAPGKAKSYLLKAERIYCDDGDAGACTAINQIQDTEKSK